MTTPIAPTVPNPYNFSSITYGKDGSRNVGEWNGTDSGNTLLGFKEAFAPVQTELNEKAAAAFADMSGDPSNLSFVAGYTTANAAMLNMFSAQSNSIKQIADKVDQLLRNMS